VQDLTGNTIAPNAQIAVSLALQVPADFGQSVNAFQDDFTGATRDPNWLPVPAEQDQYEQTDGLLRVTVVGDTLDTHLLYVAPGYSDSAQEVLARIRVTSFGTGDAPRSGVSVAVDPETSQGINLHFRDNNQDGVEGRQFKLLDDRRAWGPPGLDIDWEDNTWYWLRLRQTTSLPEETPNIQAKVWLADGTVPEPGEWQMEWTRADRVGFAGLVGSSVGGLSEYEVDYILIKAEGLPNTTIGSSTFPPSGEAPGTTIDIARSGASVVISWTGGGTLESASAINGPWTAVAGAASPHSVTISGTTFYRVRR
jgi:hypothetical protein